MDGVLADFTLAAVEAFDRRELINNWPIGLQVDERLGFPKYSREFWKQVYEMHPDFWHHVKPHTWAQTLWFGLNEIAPVTILSKPDHNPASLYGKLCWLQRTFDKSPFIDYVFTRDKSVVAGPGKLLIDDDEETIRAWKKNGGIGVIFPMPWNMDTRPMYDESKIARVLEVVATHRMNQPFTAST